MFSRHRYLLRTLFFLALLFQSGLSAKSVVIETKDFNVIDKKVAALAKTYGAKNVLIAVDCDNTLLQMPVYLGSDAWWGWQSKLLFDKTAKDKKDLVATSFDGLLEAQGHLFTSLPMVPPQAETPGIVKKWAQSKHPLFVLTSRSFDFKHETLRELLKNGYYIEGPAPKWETKLRFDPYKIKTVAATYGFTPEEVKKFKLDRKPREIAYRGGVMMTAGQHKGAMLKIFLAETKASPKAVVFVDDHPKHAKRVAEAFKNSKIEVISYRYGKLDDWVNAFGPTQRSHAASQWNQLQAAYQKGDTELIKRTFEGILPKTALLR